MSQLSVGSGEYDRLFSALDRTAFEPAAWSEVCDRLSQLVGGSGALFVPVRTEQRLQGVPVSESLAEPSQRYFTEGWNLTDPRAASVPLMLARGFAADQDIVSPDVMARHPHYSEYLAPHRLKWFLGVPFKVQCDIWCAAVQGSPARGPFLMEDGQRLLGIHQQLTIAAKRSARAGFDRAENWKASFEMGGRGVLAVNTLGQICAVSPTAEALLAAPLVVRSRELTADDPILASRLMALIHAAVRYDPWKPSRLPPPVTVQRTFGPPLSVEALPMPRDFQSLLTDTVALVLIRELDVEAVAPGRLLRDLYGLTPSEVRLALALSQGANLVAAAVDLGITIGTARNHLKSIFYKTDTHRQAELVALLVRFMTPV